MNLDKKVCFEKTGFTSIQLYMFWGSFFMHSYRHQPFWGFVTPWAVPSTRPMAPMDGEKWLEVQLPRLRSDQCHLPTPVMGCKWRLLWNICPWWFLFPMKSLKESVKCSSMFFQVPSGPLFETELRGLAQNGQSLKKQTWGVLWQLFGKLVRWRCMSWEMISMLSPEYLQKLSAIQQPTQCCGSLTSIGTILTHFPHSSENNTHIISILKHVVQTRNEKPICRISPGTDPGP